jgi:hypothetical protein
MVRGVSVVRGLFRVALFSGNPANPAADYVLDGSPPSRVSPVPFHGSPGSSVTIRSSTEAIASSKRQSLSQLGYRVHFNQRPTDDEVLLDLRIEPPGSMLPPLLNEGLGDHSSGSTSAFTITFHFNTRVAPVTASDRRRGI